MSISRYLFFSTGQRPRQCLNLLQRLGPSKSVQSSCFSKSTRQNHWKRTVPQVEVELQAPRFLVIPAAILGFVGLAAFVHFNDERRAVPKGRGSDCVSIKGPIIGGPFTLVNTQNKVVTEKDFLGNWVLLYFGYTSSPDVGPEQLKLITKAINTLESKENLMVLPMFVTLDPQRDNPPHLRAYLEEFESRIVGLTGPVGAIRQMAQEYRVYFRKVEEEGGDYLVDTSHNMYLINPNMEVVKCFGVEYNAEELSEAIGKEIGSTSGMPLSPMAFERMCWFFSHLESVRNEIAFGSLRQYVNLDCPFNEPAFSNEVHSTI